MKKQKHSLIIISILSSIFFIKPCSVIAQKPTLHDTSYYVTYPNSVTPRVYLSQKYAVFILPSVSDKVKDLRYAANTKLNTGIGATYHNFSANISYGFGFLNRDIEKGETKSFDLQAHLYRQKWAIDALALFYKGFALYPKDYARNNSTAYYYRPDVKFDFFGLAAYRLLNGEKFSYKAAMIQNEWQKRSSGSLLLGGEASYGIIKADSALVPKQAENTFPQAGIESIKFLNLGPGAGYAYTLVIKKHFFVMGSLIANVDISFSSEERINGTNHSVSLNPGFIYKAATGYNSNTWNVSINCVGNGLWVGSESTSKRYILPTGNYRIILAKKIDLKDRKFFLNKHPTEYNP